MFQRAKQYLPTPHAFYNFHADALLHGGAIVEYNEDITSSILFHFGVNAIIGAIRERQ